VIDCLELFLRGSFLNALSVFYCGFELIAPFHVAELAHVTMLGIAE
jgi:hypothetical protein